MDRISPELALVDEQLGAAARRGLPDVSGFLGPSLGTRVATGRPEAPRPETTGAGVTRLVALPIAVVAIACVLAVLPRGTGGAEDAAQSASSAKARPNTPPAAVRRLRWNAVPGADYYNVIFWRNGARSLDLWPRTSAVKLRQGKLERGSYQWFVYPAFETRAGRRYGRMIAHGRLTI